MNTSCMLSNITWNSSAFLVNKLNKLLDTEVIDFYSYIFHLPDVDATKPHYHILLIPHSKINTDTLRQEFEEIDPNNVKPIRPLPFSRTKDYGDWYLYSLHDIDYLASKGQARNIHYKKEDMKYSDKDFFDYLVGSISLNSNTRLGILESAVRQGKSWEEIVMTKMIPPNQYVGYKATYDSMYRFIFDIGNEYRPYDNL